MGPHPLLMRGKRCFLLPLMIPALNDRMLVSIKSRFRFSYTLDMSDLIKQSTPAVLTRYLGCLCRKVRNVTYRKKKGDLL